MRAAPLALLLLLAASGVSRARAHDLWIEPSTFRPQPGERVAVRLRVGEGFQGDAVPRDPARIERFAAVGAAGETEVAGVPWGEPAGFVSLGAPGLSVIVYDSHRASLQQEAEKFDRYLDEEGLERIRAQRAGQDRPAAPVREVYSRCAKALVGEGGGGHDRVVGLALELVPEADPTALRPGEDFPVRLLHEGRPLEGALVTAILREHPHGRTAARTDAAGRVRLRLDRGGDWLVKAVHMIPAPAGTGADWESFWASLTFRSRGW